MRWQDVGFTVGSLIMTIGILPMVFHKTKPPLLASVPVVVVLYFFAFMYATLGFVLAPAVEAVQATLWLVLVVQALQRRTDIRAEGEAARALREAVIRHQLRKVR
jgi:hypothetical protein